MEPGRSSVSDSPPRSVRSRRSRDFWAALNFVRWKVKGQKAKVKGKES